MGDHVKMKYPNIPEGFAKACRDARHARGLTLIEMGKDIGITGATISQHEREVRNFSYERAVLFRDYLGVDMELPLPDKSLGERVTRNRSVHNLQKDPFYIELDGELIQVVTYRNYGKLKLAIKKDV